jgi:hypothetical protein
LFAKDYPREWKLHKKKEEEDFFLWEVVKNKVYFPPLPVSVDYLHARITGTVTEVMPDLLHCTWEEIHCRRDICSATPGSHIEL